MKGINTLGQELKRGGFASLSAPRGGVSHLAFPSLAQASNHRDAPFPLASLGNKEPRRKQRGINPITPIRSAHHKSFHMYLGCPDFGYI